MINFLTYIFLLFISNLFSILPRSFSIYLGKLLGTILLYFIPLRKNVARFNINLAFPNKTHNEKKYILHKMYKHYGILIIEFLRQRKISVNSIPIHIDENTKNILSRDQGAILMTAHLGNWEMIIPILNKYKKTSVVVRVQRNLGGNKFVTECRDNENIDFFIKFVLTYFPIQLMQNGFVWVWFVDQNHLIYVMKNRHVLINFL